VRELGGLPLALDQAGAYIEETHCGLADYRLLYQKERKALHKRRGGKVDDHPEPVATTWAISFAKVEEKNPAAADLLRLLAFLAPDDILEEMLVEGAAELDPPLGPAIADDLARNDAIAALLDYSLVRRNSTNRALSLHRLVQAVLRDDMDKQTYREWAERAVHVVNAAFPTSGEFANWPVCERLLPHALACAALIEREQMMLPEAARLLNQAGYYLKERGRYAEAERLYERALAIREQQLGPEHPDTAMSLNNLAALYDNQGKYSQAEPLCKRALAIYERALGGQHPNTIIVRKNYVTLLREQEAWVQQEGQQSDAGEKK
jgi:tetratricopeptide (TPR) repeat protein